MIDDPNAAVGMLPLPRIPRRPPWPSADAVAALAGEDLAAPIRDADEAQRAAADAVDYLERHRPGSFGTKWREALQADAADHAAGRTPTKWAAARLLEDDPNRWAYARVLCGALSGAWVRAGAALDKPRIRKEAEKAAADITRQFERVAREGWEDRTQQHLVWPLRAQGDALIDKFRQVQGVVDWCDGATFDPANAGYIPGDGATRGYWLATELHLHPKRHMTTIPNDVIWPEGSDKLLGIAIPVGGRGADLRQQGYHETEVPR